MKLKEWLQEWSMSKLQIKAGILELEFSPNNPDKNAAWDLYVELLTRITTQPLAEEDGDEKIALDSVYILFPLTREIIKKYGRFSILFTKIAIVVLNQIVRPFTAKWHRISLKEGFKDPHYCEEFRKELSDLQQDLRIYTQMLANMADVEDLTDIDKG